MISIDELHLIQGTKEWLNLRKTKITATDACVIMGASPWKTRIQLYHEKLSDEPPSPPNERMQRGIDLEPIARDLFHIQTGIHMVPKVVIKDWCMASLDGISDSNQILEIKCPGEKDHSIAISGLVPDHYYPQLQHQMYVCDSEKCFYFSFDGLDGVIVEVARNEDYISQMIKEEKKFYECLVDKIPPEHPKNDYIERSDPLWEKYASKWKEVTYTIKELQKEEEFLREQLIALCGESNTKGAGISLCQVQRKGTIDYAKIAELKDVNLELYRKPSTDSWRISVS